VSTPDYSAFLHDNRTGLCPALDGLLEIPSERLKGVPQSDLRRAADPKRDDGNRVGLHQNRTSDEHPFYGSRLRKKPIASWRSVSLRRGHLGCGGGLARHRRVGPFYNLRVADWHTYFVGDQDWGEGRLGAQRLCAGAKTEDTNRSLTELPSFRDSRDSIHSLCPQC
jgi:hypothetical protein